jgi:transposase-like protein
VKNIPENGGWDGTGQLVRGKVATAVMRDVEQLLEAGGQEELMSALDSAVVEGIEVALSTLAERYADQALGADRHERVRSRQGYRSGTRTRRWQTPLGTLNVTLVKSRERTLVPPFLQSATRFAKGVVDLGRELWLRGLSTRGVSAVASDVLGGAASHTEVASWVQEARDEVLTWLSRPLNDLGVKYLVLDGIYVPVMRQTSKREAILVALGITADGHKQVLDVMHAPTESHEHWKTLLARLKGRGLKVGQLALVISDGADGLMGAIKEELPGVTRQRCTVHKVRNVVGKCPRSLKATLPRQASAIWKAPNRAEAKQRAKAFVSKYEQEHPDIIAIIRDDLDATMAFYDLDAKVWRSLCSTNILERVNRELKRKFDKVGALKGDQAATTVAALLSIELNKEWEHHIVNGFRKSPRRNARSPS